MNCALAITVMFAEKGGSERGECDYDRQSMVARPWQHQSLNLSHSSRHAGLLFMSHHRNQQDWSSLVQDNSTKSHTVYRA